MPFHSKYLESLSSKAASRNTTSSEHSLSTRIVPLVFPLIWTGSTTSDSLRSATYPPLAARARHTKAERGSPLKAVHRPMIVSVQDETKAPQPSVVQMVQAAE